MSNDSINNPGPTHYSPRIDLSYDNKLPMNSFFSKSPRFDQKMPSFMDVRQYDTMGFTDENIHRIRMNKLKIREYRNQNMK
jgi:hypothetical protein